MSVLGGAATPAIAPVSPWARCPCHRRGSPRPAWGQGTGPPPARYSRTHLPGPGRHCRRCPALPGAPAIKGDRKVLINILTPQANICRMPAQERSFGGVGWGGVDQRTGGGRGSESHKLIQYPRWLLRGVCQGHSKESAKTLQGKKVRMRERESTSVTSLSLLIYLTS